MTKRWIKNNEILQIIANESAFEAELVAIYAAIKDFIAYIYDNITHTNIKEIKSPNR